MLNSEPIPNPEPDERGSGRIYMRGSGGTGEGIADGTGQPSGRGR